MCAWHIWWFWGGACIRRTCLLISSSSEVKVTHICASFAVGVLMCVYLCVFVCLFSWLVYEPLESRRAGKERPREFCHSAAANSQKSQRCEYAHRHTANNTEFYTRIDVILSVTFCVLSMSSVLSVYLCAPLWALPAVTDKIPRLPCHVYSVGVAQVSCHNKWERLTRTSGEFQML